MISNPIRIGVLGLRFGLQQMKSVLESDLSRYIDIHAVCDSDRHRLQAGQESFACAGYDDADRFLLEADIEAVALFTGPVGRAKLIRKILNAGKDVMTTKPFELDPDEAFDVLQLAKRTGRVIHLNSPSAAPGSDISQILSWQKQFDLGDLIFSRLDCWYKRHEEADGTWYDDPSLCPVAPCFRLGIYAINDLIALGGKPMEVQVLQSRKLTGRPTPDIAQLSIRFENGAISSIQNTWCCHPSRGVHASEFVFERGIIVRGYDHEVHESAKNITLSLDAIDGEGARQVQTSEIPLECGNDAYRWDLFYDAVRKGRTNEDTYTSAIVAGIRVIAAMARAQASGRTERVFSTQIEQMARRRSDLP